MVTISFLSETKPPFFQRKQIALASRGYALASLIESTAFNRTVATATNTTTSIAVITVIQLS